MSSEQIIKPSPALLMGKGKLSGTVDAPSATLTASPMSPPKPPRPKRFIKLAKALFKVVKVVGSIGSAIRGGQTIWDVLEPLLGRKRQPAQVSPQDRPA